MVLAALPSHRRGLVALSSKILYPPLLPLLWPTPRRSSHCWCHQLGGPTFPGSRKVQNVVLHASCSTKGEQSEVRGIKVESLIENLTGCPGIVDLTSRARSC